MKKSRISLLFGAILLIILVAGLDPREVFHLLANISLPLFLAALAINLFDEIVAARILYIALGEPDIKFKDVFLSHMSGMLYSDVTPSRIGYYYTAISISKKLGTKKSFNIGVLTGIQGVVFATKAFGVLLGLAYFSYVIGETVDTNLWYAALTFPLAGFAGVLLFLYTDIPQKMLGRMPALDKMIKYVTAMQEAVKGIPKKDFGKILTLTLVIWFLVGVQWYLIAHSIGVDLSLIDAILLRPIITAIGFIPLTPNGLGVSEGGGAILFKLMGFGYAEGLSFVLLTRVNQILINGLALLDLKRS